MRTLLLRTGFAVLAGIVVVVLSMAWSERAEAVASLAAAKALDIESGKVQAHSFNGSDERGIAVHTGPLGNPSFPTEGNTFLILSTGVAADAKLPNDEEDLSTELDGLNNQDGYDMVQLDLTLVAPLDATCMRFDWAFFSEEYPEWVGSEFNDGFVVQIGRKSFSIVGDQIVVSPTDSNIARDPVDSSVMDVSSAVAFHGGTGTTYDGATDLLTASVPVISGEKIQVVFYIQDLGDSVWDSAVFLDNLRWTQDTGAACPATIQVSQSVFTVLGAWSVAGSKALFRAGSIAQWVCDPNDPNAQVVLRFQYAWFDSDVVSGTGRTTFTHTLSLSLGGVVCLVDGVEIGKIEINPVFIDPSGRVFDTNSGLSIPGATVTLQVELSPGVFEVVPLDPMLKDPVLNPELTGLDGRYAWDVVPGVYRVDVAKLGCTSVTSISVVIPPPVTDLDVGIECTDTDGDGIPNFMEASTDTNPNSSDSDGNGTPDGDDDPDGDGLTNLEELALGTDPLSPDNVDSDGDGCTNSQELGDNAILGGRRDSANFWDFFDPNRDRAVGLLDFLAVLRHFGTAGDPSTFDPDGPEPPAGEYWALADRGGQAPGGDPWDELPANGSIGLSDFLSVLRQFGHTCA